MDVRPASSSNPKIPGMDFSGTIHSLGSAVDGTRFQIGDQVFGLAMDIAGKGTMQQYLAIKPAPPGDEQASHVFINKPEGLTHAQAAALPLVYSTIYTGFVHYGHLALPSRATGNEDARPAPRGEGKSVLILGGSGGTGSLAIQFARQIPEVGGRIVTSCSAKNAGFVKTLSAAEVGSPPFHRRGLQILIVLVGQVIDYTSQDVVEAALNSPYAPFDLVFDCVGGADFIPHLDKLLVHDEADPKRGMYVTIVGDSKSSLHSPASRGRVVDETFPPRGFQGLDGRPHHERLEPRTETTQQVRLYDT